jgi:hypothetical protein
MKTIFEPICVSYHPLSLGTDETVHNEVPGAGEEGLALAVCIFQPLLTANCQILHSHSNFLRGYSEQTQWPAPVTQSSQ